MQHPTSPFARSSPPVPKSERKKKVAAVRPSVVPSRDIFHPAGVKRSMNAATAAPLPFLSPPSVRPSGRPRKSFLVIIIMSGIAKDGAAHIHITAAANWGRNSMGFVGPKNRPQNRLEMPFEKETSINFQILKKSPSLYCKNSLSGIPRLNLHPKMAFEKAICMNFQN